MLEKRTAENKKYQQAQKNTGFHLLKVILFLSQATLLISCGILLYGIFGDEFSDLFAIKQAPIVSNNYYPTGPAEDNWDKVVNGVHVRSGLVFDKGFETVRGTCTACHSAKLITQNRASRAGWKEMIVWMQQTQGLADLGKKEPIILDYLAKHYAPQESGRRANLDLADVEWYLLNLEE